MGEAKKFGEQKECEQTINYKLAKIWVNYFYIKGHDRDFIDIGIVLDKKQSNFRSKWQK